MSSRPSEHHPWDPHNKATHVPQQPQCTQPATELFMQHLSPKPYFFFWPRLEGEVWDPNQPCAASPELPADKCCPWQPPAMLCPAWPPELSCDSKTAPTKATSLHKPKHRLQRRGGHGLSAFGSPWRHNRCKEQGNASWFCSLHEKQLW